MTQPFSVVPQTDVKSITPISMTTASCTSPNLPALSLQQDSNERHWGVLTSDPVSLDADKYLSNDDTNNLEVGDSVDPFCDSEL